MKKIKIGFIISKYKGLATKYNYGLEQNTYFLVQLFRSIPEFDVSYVICEENVLEESLKNRTEVGEDTPLVEQKDLNPDLDSHLVYDVLITTEAYLAPNLMKKIKEKYSTKIVEFHAGIIMWGLMEDVIYNIENRFSGALLQREPGMVDEIWISPHHAYHKSYVETVSKSRVTISPYLYEPWFLQKLEIDRTTVNPNFNPRYQKNNNKHIGILEPNINLVKNFIIPTTIVESLYSQDASIFGRKNARIYCSNHIIERQAFKHFYGYLSCQKILSSEKRYPVIDIFHSDCSLVISHQHLCELNYLYLDALYYDIPLVHNSPFLQDCGYYYPEFDVKKGALALKQALTEHDLRLDEYRDQAQKTLYRYSTKNPDNVRGYRNIIQNLVNAQLKQA